MNIYGISGHRYFWLIPEYSWKINVWMIFRDLIPILTSVEVPNYIQLKIISKSRFELLDPFFRSTHQPSAFSTTSDAPECPDCY